MPSELAYLFAVQVSLPECLERVDLNDPPRGRQSGDMIKSDSMADPQLKSWTILGEATELAVELLDSSTGSRLWPGPGLPSSDDVNNDGK